MKKLIIIFLLLMTCSVYSSSHRLKDIVTIKGVRENPIIGYGLVIGLKGSGDGGGEITNTALRRMFEKLGLNPKREIESKNVASVIVTAKLPAFARIGQKMDVTVSSIADASSLAGGVLLVTPLKGGDGQIYGVASGNVSLGGLVKGARFPTVGMVTNGATVEREVIIDFDKKKSLRISLNRPDFTTAARIEKILNEELSGKYARARDGSTIDLIIPDFYKRKVVKLVAIIENFRVNSDSVAKIIINERTGTIVAGGDIYLQDVAISHGDLTIQIGDSGGEEGGNNDRSKSLYYMPKKATLKELVKGLNALGTSPEDLIPIFQALKRSGALIGEIELI
ncbi:MAG: flagellar basal body P-ring protein FlgI [Bacteriovoracaceae bacterium]|nr:flagellar basal body P-ring protein FlgI [Bacteriovoracaceae bacterium]